MELALDLLVIVLQISWTFTHPTKPALSDWSKPQIKSIEQDAVDKQVNDYLMPLLSSHIDRSTPAPSHLFQQKDIRQITDLSDLIKYLPPSLLTKKINFGGKKGSLLQITAVKPKSRSTSKAPLAILLATNPKDNKNSVKFIDSVVDDKDGLDANESLELKPDTSDAKAVNEAKAAEEPRQEKLATNTNDLAKKAVPFLTDLELQNVFNEVLQDSDWKEDNADLILPDNNETEEEINIQKLNLAKQNPEKNHENYIYPRADADKELKDLGNHFQKKYKNKIFNNKEKEKLSKTKAEKSDHKDDGPKTHVEHGNEIRTSSYNENKTKSKNKTNSYENEDKMDVLKHEQEPRNDLGYNQRTIHEHHHHEILNETGHKYEAKNQEDKPYTRIDLDNETMSMEREHPDHDTKNEDKSYENDEIFINDIEKNYHEHQENQELKHGHQVKSYENDDNQLNEDEVSNYQENSHELHEKHVSKELKYDHHASNHGHKEDQENNYQETSHKNPEKQVISEPKQDQQERNQVHDEDQEHNNEDKNYQVSDDKEGERDHVARSHDARGHDVRLHGAYDHQAETDKTLTEDTMAEITQFDAGNNQEILLSDDTIARLQVALTKAQEAENQLKSKSNECSQAELIRPLNNSESTKKSDHDNSNAKSYTLSFLFNK